MGKTKRWWKPSKHCEIVRSSGCLVVRWQKSNTTSGTRRNWAELHSDILLQIFKKLAIIDILTTARLVCQKWNLITSSERLLWRKIDMTDYDYSSPLLVLERIAMIAIDKSEGTLEEFYAYGFVTDDLLQYIARRTNSLKRLGLFLCPDISVEGLTTMAQRLWTKSLSSLRLIRCFHRDFTNKFANIIKSLPMLVELEVTLDMYGESMWSHEIFGPGCQQLRCFRFNNRYYSQWRDPSPYPRHYDNVAYKISDNMHHLQSHQLIGNKMTNKGLEAILKGCPDLEFLDIRHCFNLVLDDKIMAKLSRIRDVRFPDESAEDYMKSISGDLYYSFYDFGPCPCCLAIDRRDDPDEDYDYFYDETFPVLDELYGDVMFLY